MRVSVLDLDSCLVGFVWFWLASGSGVWWNTGKSLRLVGSPSSSQALWDAAGDCLGVGICSACENIRARGYDTAQLTQLESGYSVELLDCRGAGLPNGRDLWVNACPPPHIELRRGLPSPRYAPALAAMGSADELCNCDNRSDHINCYNSPSLLRS